MAAKEDVVGRPELVTPVRRSLLLLAFPGPVLGSARVHKCVAPHTHTHTHTHTHERAQTTEHFHLHARTQFQAPSSHKEHRGSSAPRSGIAAACAHADSEAVEGWRSNCPACTSTRERLAQHSRAEGGEIEPTLLAARTLCRSVDTGDSASADGCTIGAGGAAHDQTSRPVTKRKRQVTELEYETDSRVDSVHDSLHTHTHTTAGGEEITID